MFENGLGDFRLTKYFQFTWFLFRRWNTEYVKKNPGAAFYV